MFVLRFNIKEKDDHAKRINKMQILRWPYSNRFNHRAYRKKMRTKENISKIDSIHKNKTVEAVILRVNLRGSHLYLCHATLKITNFGFLAWEILHCTGFMHAEQIFKGESKRYSVIQRLKSWQHKNCKE